MVLTQMLTPPPPEASKEHLEAYLKLLAEAYQSTCTLARNLQVAHHTHSLGSNQGIRLPRPRLNHATSDCKPLKNRFRAAYMAWRISTCTSPWIIYTPREQIVIDRCHCRAVFGAPCKFDVSMRISSTSSAACDLQELVRDADDVMEHVEAAFSETLENYPEMEMALLRLQYAHQPAMVRHPSHPCSHISPLPVIHADHGSILSEHCCRRSHMATG